MFLFDTSEQAGAPYCCMTYNLFMTSIGPQWHQIIKNANTQRPEALVAVAIDVWQKLALQLISIIGEGGFQSLYARSLHLTSAAFPWIAESPAAPTDSRFVNLKINLEGRDPVEAGEANIALLITFIDILALLIGEHLTLSILRSTWGDEALDAVVKEMP
jgi:hypothetical protein